MVALHLPEVYQDVARAVGVENTLKLAEYLGGMYMYFPKLDALIRQKRDESIRAEFDGSNYRELARKHKLTEQSIRNIVNGSKDSRQTDMFS